MARRTKKGEDRQNKVYLFHIGRKPGRPPRNPKKLGEKCFHYLGTTNALARRLSEHFSGYENGSKMLNHAKQLGLKIEIARVWIGQDENFERFLKRTKRVPDYCPMCHPDDYIKNAGSNRGKTVREMWDGYWISKGKKGDKRY